MANGLVIHVVAGLEKHTEVLTSDRIRIGSSDSCELRLPDTEFPHQGTVLELSRSNGHYRIKSYDSTLGITHNGEPITSNKRLDDGDEVRIGNAGVMLTFFPVGGLPALVPGPRAETHVAPFVERAALESAATERRDDAKVFLREFTRELVREISLTTKLVTLLIAVCLAGGVLYLGFGMYRELQTSRRVIDEQNRQIGEARRQLGETADQIRQLDDKNKDFVASLTFAPSTWNKYHRGVCLISGTYYFVERGTGRPLRYPEAQENEDATATGSTNDPMQLTPEGKGAIYEREFVGTGFYVGGEYVLTNRHVVQPWQADEGILTLNTTVASQPRLKKIMAFFPDSPQPITLKFKQAAQTEDLAVCTFDEKELPEGVPVLPLDKDSDAVGVGKAVVLMGYPNGPDRILALLTDAERMTVTARYGSSVESLLNYLSQAKRIQPLTTQGHITDLDSRLIVYDATTATGGSGSPLFGQSGRVIGVNFEVFTENTASNHAVPIRYAVALLQRVGWQPPEAPDTGQNENGNANQNQPRTGASSNNSAR